MEVSDATWLPSKEASGGEVSLRYDDGTAAACDFVWLATGGNLDLALVPILASMAEQRPIQTAGGLPLLQPNLAWDVNCPMYVMGAFAALQVTAAHRMGYLYGPPSRLPTLLSTPPFLLGLTVLTCRPTGQLGADALNLAGARSGSVLVARALLGKSAN